MKEISIYYLAKVADIPPRTISLNVKALLDGIPELAKKMKKNENL